MERCSMIRVVIALLFVVNIISCKKENEETLINKQGGPGICDTLNTKYSLNILPIIQNNCYSCHGNGQSEGGITLDGHNNLKIQADNNNLVGVITHTPGYPQMPEGLPQLSDCDINKIKNWVSHGAPDN